jgi:4-carboxymuconolactone decarboxylase
MADLAEKKAYLKEMMESRGYIFDLHKILAAEDFDFLKKYQEISRIAYTDERLLDRKTKELIFVAILTIKQSSREHIKTHIEAALKAGASKEEILQVLELTFLPGGAVNFLHAFEAFKEALSPDMIEPE